MPVDVAGRRATRIAKVVVDLSWWLGLLVFVMLVVLFLSAPLLTRASGVMAVFDWNSFEVEPGNGPVGVGLALSIADDSVRSQAVVSLDTMRASAAVLKQESVTRLEFRTRGWFFFYLVNALLLPYLAAVLFGVHLLRWFLSDVLSAQVFTRRNAGRLSRLGWLVIVLDIVGPRLEQLRAWLILERTPLSGAALAPGGSGVTGLWLVGVLILVLGAAWRYGAELQQDRDLTV